MSAGLQTLNWPLGKEPSGCLKPCDLPALWTPCACDVQAVTQAIGTLSTVGQTCWRELLDASPWSHASPPRGPSFLRTCQSHPTAPRVTWTASTKSDCPLWFKDMLIWLSPICDTLTVIEGHASFTSTHLWHHRQWSKDMLVLLLPICDTIDSDRRTC